MGGGNKNKGIGVERAMVAGTIGLMAPLAGCLLTVLMVTVVILAGAGGILGWLFGGLPPGGEGNKEQAPGAEIHFWTPTPVPNSCFVTPTAVAVTTTPKPLVTPGPGETPVATPTSETIYLPTPTACPTSNLGPTPNPAWTPAPPGYGPHGNPFRSDYWVTQPYGCTDFPEFKDQACASATGGLRPWFHRGIDLVSKGSPVVYSTMAGTVIFSGFAGDGFGIRVYLKAGPFLVIYPHLRTTLVVAGQSLEWGQPLGVEGSTGYSTGDHLHYEIHFNDAYVDSSPYLLKP